MPLSYLLLSLLLSDAESNRTSHVTREACNARFPRRPSRLHGCRPWESSGRPRLTWRAGKAPGIPVQPRRDQLLPRDVYTCTAAATADPISRQQPGPKAPRRLPRRP